LLSYASKQCEWVIFRIKIWFIFPPHLTDVSALPCETGNPEIACVYLNAVLCLTCFDNRHTEHVQIVT